MIVILDIAVVVTLVLARGCNTQTVKTWKFNTNFNNTENWDRHEVPCKTSVVIFPMDMQIPVILPTTRNGESILEMRRIVLSRQGWLIFPRMKGGISLSNEEIYASCSGGDFKFVRTGSKKWADPDSWLASPEYSSKATPNIRTYTMPIRRCFVP
uniref:Protein amnionless n=1 Tax=Lygus hesperus TaxID=30085 RepID=A0A0A9XA23_LYGHE